MRVSILPLTLLLSTSLALPSFPVPAKIGYPFAILSERAQTCAETCGTVCYYRPTIDRAVAEGYELYQNGETEGSGKYPHTYNNYEGFDLAVSGPYQEFPILHSFKDYSGGSPGADRVVFNTDGELAAVVTHTGAQGNDFLECDG